MDSSSLTVGGFQMTHLMVIFIVMGCALFIIYWLWVYPCNGDANNSAAQQSSEEARVVNSRVSSSSSSRSGRVVSLPEAPSSSGGEIILYAMEIEPGTVVLQSPYGDMFRVLREYDSVTQNGTSTSGLPPGTSFPVHYIPAYTRAHVQNPQASAPPYPGTENEHLAAPPYSENWRPLCIQSGNDY
ncbi:hypothetical protein ACOMHN_051916 [Nucella lapillus]